MKDPSVCGLQSNSEDISLELRSTSCVHSLFYTVLGLECGYPTEEK